MSYCFDNKSTTCSETLSCSDSISCSDSMTYNDESVKCCRVKFNHDVDIREIPSRKDIPRKDRRKLWLAHKDFSIQQEKCRNAFIDLMESKQHSHDASDFRGLENVSPHNLQKRQQKATKLLSAVLVEQHRQRSNGSYDPEAMREVYWKLSGKCKQDALKVASHDRKVVKTYLSSVEKETENLQLSKDSDASVFHRFRTALKGFTSTKNAQ